MGHVYLGRKLPFALLNLELWRCWRERCGCYYAGHFVDGDDGDGFCCLPAFETNNRYYRDDLCYAGHTTIFFEVFGEFYPRHGSLAFKSIFESIACLFVA